MCGVCGGREGLLLFMWRLVGELSNVSSSQPKTIDSHPPLPPHTCYRHTHVLPSLADYDDHPPGPLLPFFSSRVNLNLPTRASVLLLLLLHTRFRLKHKHQYEQKQKQSLQLRSIEVLLLLLLLVPPHTLLSKHQHQHPH